MVILQDSHVIVLNQNGDIINTFEDTRAVFKDICTDSYGNILVADYSCLERVNSILSRPKPNIIS
jgi:hypothetical protein